MFEKILHTEDILATEGVGTQQTINKDLQAKIDHLDTEIQANNMIMDELRKEAGFHVYLLVDVDDLEVDEFLRYIQGEKTALLKKITMEDLQKLGKYTLHTVKDKTIVIAKKELK